MENNNPNTEADNTAEKSESTHISFREILDQVFIKTPMAVKYAQFIIRTSSEAFEKQLGKSQLGKDIPAALRVNGICKVVTDAFRDPDCLFEKDKFIYGAVMIILLHQMKEDAEKQTDKKEETNA